MYTILYNNVCRTLSPPRLQRVRTIKDSKCKEKETTYSSAPSGKIDYRASARPMSVPQLRSSFVPSVHVARGRTRKVGRSAMHSSKARARVLKDGCLIIIRFNRYGRSFAAAGRRRLCRNLRF